MNGATVAELREELDELQAELDERNEWAESLASALDVPGDLDPFFGIDRVAREHARWLREIDAGRRNPVVAAQMLPALAQELRETAAIMDWWGGEEYRQFANAIDRILAYWDRNKTDGIKIN